MFTKILAAGIAMAALSAWPSSRAYAVEHEHSKSEIKLLRDSAKALGPINADLSGRLRQYAAKEAGETEENESAQAESSQSGDVQLLKESASALEGSRPDLAKRLKKFAAQESRERKKESSDEDSRGTKEESQPREIPSSGY